MKTRSNSLGVKLGCVGMGVASALTLAGCPGDPEGGDSGPTLVDAFVPEGVDAGPLPDAFTPPTDDTGTPSPDAFVGTDAFMGGGDDCARTGYPALSLVDVASGYDWTRPVFLTHAPGSSDLYVVDARGFIYIVRAGAVLPTPFLDMSSSLGGTPSGGDERGLLGLAFHPDYATNGRFFVGYTPIGGDNIVAEGRRSTASADVADAAITPVITVDDFMGNHNGGMVAFGPDGYLYIGTGDGGGGGDPRDTAQDPTNLLGKMLRIDVDAPSGGEEYGIPSDNPFVGDDGVRDEIWAFGYRNPWRFSFDRLTGEMYIGDVGQGRWEEIDVEPAAASGRNYGWSQFEGTHDFAGGDDLRAGDTHTPPVYEFEHDSSSELLRSALSVTGGYVYRGAIEGLRGAYVFGDYASPDLVAFRYCDGEVRGAARLDVGGAVSGVVSFGEDAAGEIYLISFGSGAQVRRFTAR
ncbi:MAG: PQQ-dependent sugar dehydrogenase [Deltaproteobacteria bacterium]|nr:PQQ-dependent sugar dehydrogenase [Deltaproteobacteria bacterium]